MWKNNRRFRASNLLKDAQSAVSRREVLGYAAVGAAGAAAAAVASGGAQATPNYLRGLGDFRRLRLSNGRTGERLDIIYYADGEYIPEALDELSFLARDWRRDEIKPVDRRTLDFAAAVYKRLETSEPLQLISGYRSPATNALLRSKGRGVAKNSFHTRAMALDLSLQSRSIGDMYAAAMSLKGGGVGKYSRSHFIHVDCGPLRSWGR
ncbi:MAG: DUF882 domain-containing protein [Neomegalonema sp.]|nr:DUF882 domain-containing protein [Neomegalonema sp.]